MKNSHIYYLIFILSLQFGCSTVEDFKVVHQVTGPVETNCYFIYGIKSKEAAIIDPGWRVDTLINFIKENNLNLKYIFVTHGHTDHLFGVPDMKKQFPKVKLCMNKNDYENLFTQLQMKKLL